MLRLLLCITLSALLLFTGCEKPLQQPISNAAYMRAFFGNVADFDFSANNFIAFLWIDGSFDANGVGRLVNPITDTLESDKLAYNPELNALKIRPSLFPANVTNGVSNYGSSAFNNGASDYPGDLPIRVGSNYNGLDLSQWAQIGPGKHRILFLTQREDTTGPYAGVFRNPLPPKLSDVIVDTTVDFKVGEYYTLQACPRPVSNIHGPFKLMVLHEDFHHDFSDPLKGFVNFVNMDDDPAAPTQFDVYYQLKYAQTTTAEQLMAHLVSATSYPSDAATQAPWMQYSVSSDSFPNTLLLNMYAPGQSAGSGATPVYALSYVLGRVKKNKTDAASLWYYPTLNGGSNNTYSYAIPKTSTLGDLEEVSQP